jgi:hypothetical protein
MTSGFLRREHRRDQKYTSEQAPELEVEAGGLAEGEVEGG